MTDSPNLIATAWRDPLAVVFALLIVGVLAQRLLFRRSAAGRALVRVVLLIVLTIAFLRAGIVPYRPMPATGMPLRDAVHVILQIAWWLWAAWFLVGVVRAIVVTEERPHEGRLVQDVLAGLIYLAAVFAIIAYVFGLPVQGLLATSGVIAIVLGLALQSTLSDLFSGIVLNFSRPYRPGDWISIEGATDGRVIEINWRATNVLTAKRDLAIVPNSNIAKAKIVNSSSPSTVHGMTVTVELETDRPPARAKEVVETAVRNCRLILANPAPGVIVKSINAAFIELDVTFYVETLSLSGEAQNALFDLIFRHLTVAGIGLAAAPNQPVPSRAPDNATPEEKLLRLVPIFETLSTDEQKTIAAKLVYHSFDQAQTLVKPGQVLQSLFIVGEGIVTATHDESEGEIELDRFGPGDHYGEIGMLTGAPSFARITTLTPAVIYELKKEDLAPILQARPEVAQKLGRALAQRQAEGRLRTAGELGDAVPKSALTAWFSERVHRLYQIASTGA